eukprot:403341398
MTGSEHGHHHGHHEHQKHEEGPLGFLVPEGLDSFNVLFISLIIISALVQIIYLLAPPKMKIWIESFDLKIVSSQGEKKTHGFFSSIQRSTVFATFFFLLTLLYLGQTSNFQANEHQSYKETAEQRQFRHRQLWTYQSYKYQCMIITAIWLGIKILMNVNRKHREIENELKELDKPKNPQDKKND